MIFFAELLQDPRVIHPLALSISPSTSSSSTSTHRTEYQPTNTTLSSQQSNAMKILNISSLPPIPPPKIPNSKKPLQLHKTLASLTPSLLFPTLAKSLTYDEALGFSNPSIPTDFTSIVDSIVKFGSENPLIVAGGVAAVLVPVFLARALGRSKNLGVEPAKSAYLRLGEDEGSQLLDIREGKELREAGSPDLGGLKKKVARIGYRGEDKVGFLKKVAFKFRDPGSVTLFVIDK